MIFDLKRCNAATHDSSFTSKAPVGHEDISTTEIYLHVATGANGLGVVSPLDGMGGFPVCGFPAWRGDAGDGLMMMFCPIKNQKS